MIELIEAARDQGLYSAITDCGAGGFSSAVGEMGEELGVEVDLARAPLKYPGLAPWEIWISEAQERMVLAVPPANLAALAELARLWDVELCVLGTFTGDGDLRVRYAGRLVADLPMAFLHKGLPQRRMKAVWQDKANEEKQLLIVNCQLLIVNEPQADPSQAGAKAALTISNGALRPFHDQQLTINNLLLLLLSIPTIASKERVVRRYDHEVRGGTVVRPFTGPQLDGPSDAAVLKPLGTWEHGQAFALSAGINPLLGKVDPYAMAVSAVDEAVRNAVAVGADPDRIAILDNFCWGNPTYPDRLGALVRACQGCYDAALAYRAPFISGKDSLYNEFNGKPIPGTLLISAIAIVPDMAACVTADLKAPGNLLFLVGETRTGTGGLDPV